MQILASLVGPTDMPPTFYRHFVSLYREKSRKKVPLVALWRKWKTRGCAKAQLYLTDGRKHRLRDSACGDGDACSLAQPVSKDSNIDKRELGQLRHGSVEAVPSPASAVVYAQYGEK